MSDNNCHKEMKSFHREKVTLSEVQQGEMRGRRDGGRKRLKSGLEEQGWDQPSHIASQGSYAMRTMVQDSEKDYDIDDGVYFRPECLVDSNGSPLSALEARERVCEALKWDGRLKQDAKVKDNCVRQMYPEGFHIDMPVYRIVDDDVESLEIENYELASGDNWTTSDARAVTRWFTDKVGSLKSGEKDGSPLRRCVKLTKYFARSRKDWKEQTTSGICITKLVVDHFGHVQDREDLTLREVWKEIRLRLSGSTSIDHPVFKGKYLAEEHDDEVSFFRECLDDALSKLDVLDNPDCDHAIACKAWDEVFNTSFFGDQPDPTGDGGKGPAVYVKSSDTTRRDDGGGRFG